MKNRDLAAVAMLLLDVIQYIEAEFDVDVVGKIDQKLHAEVVKFVEDIEGR